MAIYLNAENDFDSGCFYGMIWDVNIVLYLVKAEVVLERNINTKHIETSVIKNKYPLYCV